MPEEGYLPIAQHGLIGDLRTCALVGTEGTIDWFCAPRFDSPSVSAACWTRTRVAPGSSRASTREPGPTSSTSRTPTSWSPAS